MRWIAELENEDYQSLADGVLLRAENGIEGENQRLLRGLLLQPAQQKEDLRLCTLYHEQKIWWRRRLRLFTDQRVTIRVPQELLENAALQQTLLRALLDAAVLCGMHRLELLLATEQPTLLCGVREMLAATAWPLTVRCGVELATPKALCAAKEIVEQAEFVFFQTERLTQEIYGLSQQDVRCFIDQSGRRAGSREQPFYVFDQIGLGTLLHMAQERIWAQQPDMRFGLIGRPALDENGRQYCRENHITCVVVTQQDFNAVRQRFARRTCAAAK